MAKLLMITGLGSAADLASGKKGAFYNTLEEFHKYWERIDIIAPKILNSKSEILNKFQILNSKSQTIVLFGNVFIHISPWPLAFHPFWFLKKGIEIYKEQKFNLMTVHEFLPFYNGIGARLLWYKIKVPYILEIHHVPGYPKAANLKEKIYRNLMRWFIKIDASKATAVRVVNKNQTPEFLIKAGVPESKIIYIPSMYIDLGMFKPAGSDKIYDLIFIGRLEANKGIDLLFQAIKFLSDKKSKFYDENFKKALIIGDGSLREFVNHKVSLLKDHVDYNGGFVSQKDLVNLINRSKILVMPSYNEGGPRVVFEAMACGVPVLATRVGLIPDFADKNAIKIIDWNAEDIAKKVKELLENENEMKRMTVAGIEIAQQFEKKEAIKNYADKIN